MKRRQPASHPWKQAQAMLYAMRAALDLSGQRFGRWTAVRLGNSKPGTLGMLQTYLCRCDCSTERDVLTKSLVNGLSRSCGVHCAARRQASVDSPG
jgi:hypothetical protein